MMTPKMYLMPVKELLAAAAGKRLKQMFATVEESDKIQTNMIATQMELAISHGRLFDFGTLDNLDRNSLWPNFDEIEANASDELFKLPFSPITFSALDNAQRHFYLAMENPLRFIPPEVLDELRKLPGATCPPEELMEASVMITHAVSIHDEHGRPRLATPGVFSIIAKAGRFVVRSMLTKSGEVLHEENIKAYQEYVNDITLDIAMFLRVLNHTSTQTTEHGPSAEESRRRRKDGLRPVPSYRAVDVASYMTAVHPVRAPSREDPVGTHASPITHERRGHYKTRNGKAFWVRSHTVNPDNPGAARSHYEVRA